MSNKGFNTTAHALFGHQCEQYQYEQNRKTKLAKQEEEWRQGERQAAERWRRQQEEDLLSKPNSVTPSEFGIATPKVYSWQTEQKERELQREKEEWAAKERAWELDRANHQAKLKRLEEQRVERRKLAQKNQEQFALEAEQRAIERQADRDAERRADEERKQKNEQELQEEKAQIQKETERRIKERREEAKRQEEKTRKNHGHKKW